MRSPNAEVAEINLQVQEVTLLNTQSQPSEKSWVPLEPPKRAREGFPEEKAKMEGAPYLSGPDPMASTFLHSEVPMV